jgi:hypothetical protein
MTLALSYLFRQEQVELLASPEFCPSLSILQQQVIRFQSEPRETLSQIIPNRFPILDRILQHGESVFKLVEFDFAFLLICKN